MKIVFKESFIRRLKNQIEYIAIDSPARARNFKTKLLSRIKQIPNILIKIESLFISKIILSAISSLKDTPLYIV